MTLPQHLYGLLSASAENSGTHNALEDMQGGSLTYAELRHLATGLQAFLSEHRLAEGCRIGILAPKSMDYVTAIFGILKCGAAYVPMDLKSPLIRNVAICRHLGLQALLIDSSQASVFSEALGEACTMTALPNSLSLIVLGQDKQKHGEALAYILSTSGSTGVPKGVMHTHQSAMAFVTWSISTFSPAPGDRFASHAPFHFDLSVFDLFVCVAAGGTLILADDKMSGNPLMLAEMLAKKNITLFYATPSTLTYMQQYGKMHKYDYSHLRLILFAGEVFPIAQLKALKDILPHVEFYNLYGPTETNVCTYYKIPAQIPEAQGLPFPIGRPCEFAEEKIDSHGELLISGTSLMAGYWNDPEKTGEAFYTDETGKRWYRTGDLVEKNAAGDLVYTGRKDRMVKRKGFRIELDEIEHALQQHELVARCAVTALPKDDRFDTRITAHLVWIEGHSLSTLELVAYCRAALPFYMIPDHFVAHAQLPQTSTHKTDYKALTLFND